MAVVSVILITVNNVIYFPARLIKYEPYFVNLEIAILKIQNLKFLNNPFHSQIQKSQA